MLYSTRVNSAIAPFSIFHTILRVYLTLLISSSTPGGTFSHCSFSSKSSSRPVCHSRLSTSKRALLLGLISTGYDANEMTPPGEYVSVSIGTSFPFSVFLETSHAQMILDTVRNRFRSARCWPGQIRRPAPKVKSSERAPTESSLTSCSFPSHLSGLKARGSSYVEGSLCIKCVLMMRMEPAGIL